ncbi:unnamed protein product [Cunninghamella echinulata]
MPLGSNLADIAHKSMNGFKKEGRLEEELAKMSAIAFGKDKQTSTPTTSST